MSNKLLRSALLMLSMLCTGVGAAAAQDAPLCGIEVKQEIAKILGEAQADGAKLDAAALELQNQLYEKYSYCAEDGKYAEDWAALSHRGYCGKLVYAGSTFYESMPCCGYDPQKRQFACPVEVRKPFGFGPAPFPGSREHVLTCVDLGFGFIPAALDSVHLADSKFDPNWYFAVISDARGRLRAHGLNGAEYVARSILSWNFQPQSCDYKPIWGNVIDYKIRLDP